MIGYCKRLQLHKSGLTLYNSPGYIAYIKFDDDDDD